MPYSSSASIVVAAPIEAAWGALTKPELVKQYFFGTDLVTTWIPGEPIFFRGEWDGKPYEDKGTVLAYEPMKTLSYDYYSSWSDLPDHPKNYAIISYSVEETEEGTKVTISQSNVDTQEKADHSSENWNGVLLAMKELIESTQ